MHRSVKGEKGNDIIAKASADFIDCNPRCSRPGPAGCPGGAQPAAGRHPVRRELPVRKTKTRKKGRLMWGLIYVGAFLVTFAASAVLKMTWHPLGDKYSVRWDDSVGTVYTDLPYGEGDANKFDLYLPADNSME